MKNYNLVNIKTAAFLVVLIYMYPFVLTLSQLGFTDIPPIFNSDMYLYLNMTDLSFNSVGNIISPWYGGEMIPAEFDYGRFSLSFLVFKAIFAISAGSWTVAIIIWTIFWVLAIYFSAYYFFKMVIGEKRNLYVLVVLALMFLLLMRTTDLKEVIYFWTHVPSSSDFADLNLAYSRHFFPQAAVPFLFLYMIFFVKLFENHTIKGWIILLVIQLLALKTFPFLLALIWIQTLIAIVIMHFMDRGKVVWKVALIMGILFIVVDALSWMSGGGTGSPAFKVDAFDFDMSKLDDMLGVSKYLIVLFSIIIAFLKPKRGISVKVVVLSLGLASLVASSIHLVLSSAFQIENHIYYFSDTILSIQMFYIAVILFHDVEFKGFKKYLIFAIFVFITFTGIAAAHSHYLKFFEHNQKITEIDQYFTKNSSSLCDEKEMLVITPAYMPAELSPISLALTHKFHILYHPDAHFLSSKLKGEPNVHKMRQSLYFYMIGKDMQWVKDAWKDSGDLKLQEELTIPGLRLLLIDGNRGWFLERQAKEMVGYFEAVENRAPQIRSIFNNYKKIILVDYIENPIFKDDRVDDYLEFVKSSKYGRFVFKEYKGKSVE
jgi:hypothetical protein